MSDRSSLLPAFDSDNMSSRRLVIFLNCESISPTFGHQYNEWTDMLIQEFEMEVRHCTLQSLECHDLQRTILIILDVSQVCFSTAEAKALSMMHQEGISLFFLSCGTCCNVPPETEETTNNSLKDFLHQFGLSFSEEQSVMQRTSSTYLHPKEALIRDGAWEGSPLAEDADLSFIYPYGRTVNTFMFKSVGKSYPLLSSGSTSHPIFQPVCMMHLFDQTKNDTDPGKILCFGSLQAFSDHFLKLEQNGKVLRKIIHVLLMPASLIYASYPKLPVINEIKQHVSLRIQRNLRPKPILGSAYLQSFNIDDYLEQLQRSAKGCSRFQQRLRLQRSIETVAQELNVSWDLDTTRIIPSLEGYLPDIPFPIFEPEAPVPGTPQLEMFDLDALLAKKRHEELSAPSPALPLPKDLPENDVDHLLDQRVNELCSAAPKGSSHLSLSDTHDLCQVIQALKHRRSQSGNKRTRETTKMDNSTNSALPRSAIPFSLAEAADYLYGPNEIPLSDAEIVEDCLVRKRRVEEAKLALECLKNPRQPSHSLQPIPLSDSPLCLSRSILSIVNDRPPLKTLSSARSSLRSSFTVLSSLAVSSSTSLVPSSNVDVWRAHDSSLSLDLYSIRKPHAETSRSGGDFGNNLLSSRTTKPLNLQNLYKQFSISSSSSLGLSDTEPIKIKLLQRKSELK